MGSGRSVRFDGTNFVNFVRSDGFGGDTALTIESTLDGVIWIGYLPGGLTRFDRETVTAFSQADGLPGGAGAGFIDTDGTAWFASGPYRGNSGSYGVARFDGASFSILNAADGLGHDTVDSIYRDRRGSLWFCTLNGLTRMDDDGLKNFTTSDGLSDNDVNSITEHPLDGSLWFTTWLGGLGRWKDGVITTYSTRDGLATNQVVVIRFDSSGVGWIGTKAGVSRFDGREFRNYTTADGLPDPWVRSLLIEADDGSGLGQRQAWRVDGTNFISLKRPRTARGWIGAMLR
jgi:ligand-binding sensor domain-containing protein